MKAAKDTAWLAKVEKEVIAFAKKHRLTLSKNERIVSAAFEVGCLHSLLNLYVKAGYSCKPQNLGRANEYRYLTTPSGNPRNFSYVEITGLDGVFHIRQQVRIQSHVDRAIKFTPDILVLRADADVVARSEKEYAGGKKKLFFIASKDVVAAHECKSLNPFPELFVSFLGMLLAAHEWYSTKERVKVVESTKGHLAPTLFVGGTARPFYLKMMKALCKSYGINIVAGLHQGTWNLASATNRLQLQVNWDTPN